MDFLVNSGLPNLPSAGGDIGKALTPVHMAVNSLAQKVSQLTGQVAPSQSEMAQLNQLGFVQAQQLNKIYVKALAALSYGKLVHLKYDGVSKIGAEYADATNNLKPAHGIVVQPAGIPNGDFGEVLLMQGLTVSLGGTTIGQLYYLSTNGDASNARPSAAGSIIQAVGIGFGSEGFYLDISSLFIQN